MRASRHHLRPWFFAAETAEAWEELVERSRDESSEVLLAVLRQGGAVIGSFHLSQIFRGGFQNAYLGFAVGAPFAGQGYMTEGLQLTLRHAFAALRLHRVEANVQPANGRSKRLVQRCGFRLEGFSPRYLKIGGRWRDHERYALTVEEHRGTN